MPQCPTIKEEGMCLGSCNPCYIKGDNMEDKKRYQSKYIEMEKDEAYLIPKGIEIKVEQNKENKRIYFSKNGELKNGTSVTCPSTMLGYEKHIYMGQGKHLTRDKKVVDISDYLE